MNTSAITTKPNSVGPVFWPMFWCLVIGSIPFAVVFTAMPIWLMVLAVGLSWLVWVKPQEAPAACMLFLFAAGVLLPYASRFDVTAGNTEMYFWAAGSLLIAVASACRIGIRRILSNLPRALIVFLILGLIASIWGIALGSALSFVARQLYGVLMLILYVGIARAIGNEDLLLRRIATFGTLVAVCFVVYYAAIFKEYGFHKEMGFVGTQACFLAVPLFLAGVVRRQKYWVFGALVLMLVPCLVFMRRDVLTFLVAVLIGLTMQVTSKTRRLLCYCGIILISLPAMFPDVAAVVATQLQQMPVLTGVIPASSVDTASLYDRGLQLASSVETVQMHPVLGEGLGSSLEIESPLLGYEDTVFVDNGWAYVLQKTGLIGLAVFIWFLVTFLRQVSVRVLGVSACLLAAVFITTYNEPVFLHFTTGPILGTYVGLLLADRRTQGAHSASAKI